MSCGDSCYAWSPRSRQGKTYEHEQEFTIIHNGVISFYMDGTLGSSWSGASVAIYYYEEDSGYVMLTWWHGCDRCSPMAETLPGPSYTRFKVKLYYDSETEVQQLTFKVHCPRDQ
jgi:hypothetical protein